MEALEEHTIRLLSERLRDLAQGHPQQVDNSKRPRDDGLPPPVPLSPLRAPDRIGLLASNSIAPPIFSMTLFFSDIHPTTLRAVLTHDLRAEDLYKLDTKYGGLPTDSGTTFTVARDGTLRVKRGKRIGKAFPTAYSLLLPLQRYFDILIMHTSTVDSLRIVGHYFMLYMQSLLNFLQRYSWPAVRSYHIHFFNARLLDMKLGHYSTWSALDMNLSATYLRV